VGLGLELRIRGYGLGLRELGIEWGYGLGVRVMDKGLRSGFWDGSWG
jgi:hypothetical protein